MRKTLLMSAALLGMSTAAFAQNTTTSGQVPAAPGASSQGVQSSNSLPAGAGNSVGVRAGSNVGSSTVGGAAVVAPGAVVTTAPPPAYPRPMRGSHRMRGHAAGMADGPGVDDGSAPPTSAYRGGAGAPQSSAASNITAGDSRSTIAPRLPDPGAASNSPEALLAAAQRSLNAGRTGAAQEALERAETRLLSRSTDPSMANAPDGSSMIQQIGAARRALANRDTAGAKAAINAAMGGRG